MTPLTPEAKKAISARVQFYRELGIHSFYRRSEAPPLEDQPIMAKTSSATSAAKAKPLPVIQQVSSEKGELLDAVRADIGDCTRCRLSKERTNIVFGTGNLDADIMFVGEGPGADEDEQGLPFVGRAGQLLNNMISAMGIQREDVYIANVVKCRPPGNRTPERDECDTCSPFLMQQIEIIKPKIIVALGAVAAKNLLGLNDSMANLRGRIYDFKNTKLAVTYHPAYLLRDPRQKAEAWKDLQMVMKHLGMTAPAGKNG
ncbi:MAG: phage polymerase-related protein [Candidatus Angelobacter sp.]|jgi:uracil-DNA glycosylase family 4|nr:phage polymerase-related protein [Candidatus Angelobacter sp.]